MTCAYLAKKCIYLSLVGSRLRTPLFSLSSCPRQRSSLPLYPSAQCILKMPAEIKFTNLGIPYLVEFANISIRSSKSAFGKKKVDKTLDKTKKKLPPPPVRCPTCGHLPDHPPRPVDDDEVSPKGNRPGGLYIRFASRANLPPTRISDRRLVRLRGMIEEAVMRAGMVRPPDEGTGSIDSHSTDGSETLRSTASDSSKKALFKGTYGQVKQALKEAGLVTTPCPEEGVEHGTFFQLHAINSPDINVC